jgi:hypothetical protein
MYNINTTFFSRKVKGKTDPDFPVESHMWGRILTLNILHYHITSDGLIPKNFQTILPMNNHQ